MANWKSHTHDLNCARVPFFAERDVLTNSKENSRDGVSY